MGKLVGNRHGHANLGKKHPEPLRKVIGRDDVGREILECGHKIFPPRDFAGHTVAIRRRCFYCLKEKK